MRPIKIAGKKYQISLINYLKYKETVRRVKKEKTPEVFECEDMITKEKFKINIEL